MRNPVPVLAGASHSAVGKHRDGYKDRQCHCESRDCFASKRHLPAWHGRGSDCFGTSNRLAVHIWSIGSDGEILGNYRNNSNLQSCFESPVSRLEKSHDRHAPACRLSCRAFANSFPRLFANFSRRAGLTCGLESPVEWIPVLPDPLPLSTPAPLTRSPMAMST